MSLFAAALLGVVQGLTEFLPISSSAHLILGRAFFGWDAGELELGFDVACHVGTLLAVVIYFRTELAHMAAALPRAFAPSRLRPDNPALSRATERLERAGPDSVGRMIRLIVLGTVPIVVAGALYTDQMEEALRTPRVAAWMLVLGAVLMIVAERTGRPTGDEHAIGPAGALAIGVAQAAALVLPGLSRSGSTISVGLFLGLRRDAAARFTFLLSVPAIVAAAAKESLELAEVGLPSGALMLLSVGLIVSWVVGYLAIRYFLRYLAGHRLDAFAYYRFALAAATFVWLART